MTGPDDAFLAPDDALRDFEEGTDGPPPDAVGSVPPPVEDDDGDEAEDPGPASGSGLTGAGSG